MINIILKKRIYNSILFLSINALLIYSNLLLGQEKATLSGYVSDMQSKETLIGVNIIVSDQTIGTITNEYGFYSLTLPEGKYVLQINYLGYQTKNEYIDLNKDITKNFELNQKSEILDEIILEENIEVLNIKVLK